MRALQVNKGLPILAVKQDLFKSLTRSLMKQSQNLTQDGSRKAYICQVCGKEGHNVAIRNHPESNHLEVSLPCNLCEKVFKSRHNLMSVKRRQFDIVIQEKRCVQ